MRNCGKVIAEPRLFVERKAGAFLISGGKTLPNNNQ